MKKKYLALCIGLALAANIMTVNAADTKKATTETTTEATKTTDDTASTAKAENSKSEELSIVYGTVKEVKDNTLKLSPDTKATAQKDKLSEETYTLKDDTSILSVTCESYGDLKDGKKLEATDSTENEESMFAEIADTLKTSDAKKLEDSLTADHGAKKVKLADLAADDYAGVVVDGDGNVQTVIVVPANAAK